MSDHYSILVFRNSTQQTAIADANKVKEYLLVCEYIVESTDNAENVLYKPGNLAPSAVGKSEFYGHELAYNVVKFKTGPEIFCESEGAEFWVICNRCHGQIDGLSESLNTALSVFADIGVADFECPICENKEALSMCNTKGFVAGFMGVEFWNWGKLDHEFLSELSDFMESEVTLIEGMI